MQLLHQSRGAASKPVPPAANHHHPIQTHICTPRALGTKMEHKKAGCNVSNFLHKTGKISKFRGKKKNEWWIWLFLQVWRKQKKKPLVMNQLQADREGSKRKLTAVMKTVLQLQGRASNLQRGSSPPLSQTAQVVLLNAVLMLPGTTSARIWQNRCYLRN